MPEHDLMTLAGWARRVSPADFAAFLAAPVTPHHTPPEPNQCPKHCGHNGVDPQRPGEAPDQEPYLDMHPVLEGEGDPYRRTDGRGDHAAGKSLIRLFRLTLLSHHTLPAGRPGGFTVRDERPVITPW